MTDTLTNIPITAGVWIDLYAASGIPVGTQIVVENIGNYDVYLAVQASQPAVGHTAYNVVKRNGDTVHNEFGDLGAWAYSNSVEGLLNVNSGGGFNIPEAPPIPLTAFGDVSVAELTPIVQVTVPYGVLTNQMEAFLVLGGTVEVVNNMMISSTAAASFSASALLSRRQVTYRAGQGLVGRLTCVYDDPVIGSAQVAGLISSTDILGFGYIGLDFNIIYQHDGTAEVQELTITTPAGGSENASITVAGTVYSVPLTAGTVQHNAIEIAASLNAQVGLFSFTSNNDQVVARSLLAAVFGAFAFSSSTAVAAWFQVAAGIPFIDDSIPQADWNLNTRPNLNPQLGNLFQIRMQYLGFGDISFYIEDPSSGILQEVHRIIYPNSSAVPSLGNPTFRLGYAISNGLTATSISMGGASVAGFIEGLTVFTESSRAFQFTNTAVTVTDSTNIITLRNRIVFGKKRNRVEVLPLTLTSATDSSKAAIISVSIGAAVAGELDFQYIDKDTSVVEVATNPGIVTNGRLVSSFVIPATGGEPFNLEALASLLLPGEVMTIHAQLTSAAASSVIITVIWQEDL